MEKNEVYIVVNREKILLSLHDLAHNQKMPNSFELFSYYNMFKLEVDLKLTHAPMYICMHSHTHTVPSLAIIRGVPPSSVRPALFISALPICWIGLAQLTTVTTCSGIQLNIHCTVSYVSPVYMCNCKHVNIYTSSSIICQLNECKWVVTDHHA